MPCRQDKHNLSDGVTHDHQALRNLRPDAHEAETAVDRRCAGLMQQSIGTLEHSAGAPNYATHVPIPVPSSTDPSVLWSVRDQYRSRCETILKTCTLVEAAGSAELVK